MKRRGYLNGKPSEKLSIVTRAKFIPLMSVLELTRRCNLKCLHCYIDQPKTYKNELSTAEIKSIISQLAKAGSMSLIFTGGEVFLRDDILELSSFARSLGFDLRIFTNGTLIDGNIAAGLAKIGISGIEISLYGKRQTHDKITGVTGSFKKAMKAINVFKEHGVRVGQMPDNQDELQRLQMDSFVR